MSNDKLPDGWTRVKLGDVAVNSTLVSSNPFEDGYERYVLGKDIPDGGTIKTWGEVGDGHFGSRIRTRIEVGDVICTTRGPNLRVARATFRALGAHTNFVLRTANKNVMLQDFLALIAESVGFQSHLVRNFRGSVNLFVNWSDAAKYEFALPPIDEQERIVGLLKTIDESIVRYQRGIDAATMLISAVVQAAREHEDTAELTLEKLFRVVGGATPSTANKENWDGGVLWATPSDLTACDSGVLAATRRQISDQGLQSCSASLVPAGSILLSTRATLGYPVLAGEEMSFNQGVTGLIPSVLANAKFFSCLLKQMEPEISRLASGSTFPEVPRSRLKTLKLQTPTRRVQDQAVVTVEHAQNVVKNLRNSESSARLLRRAILSELIGEQNVH